MKMSLLIPIFSILLLFACQSGKNDEQKDAGRDSISLALRISQQSKLYTAEYRVHKIVTHNDIKNVTGSIFGHEFKHQLPISERKIAIPIDVTLQAYVDFSSFSDSNINRFGKKIHITLPDPKVVVSSSKIDNEGVVEHVSFLRSNFTDAELNEFALKGVESVVATVPEMGILDTARESAARILIPLIIDMGYEEQDITISFRKDFEESDLPSLFDNEHSVIKIN